jgi:hypothetical protein
MARPPSGFPMPNLDLIVVLEDEWGTLFHDERGYMWRGPEYLRRFDVLKVVDPSMTGGWQKIGNWFRTRKANPQYAPSSLETIVHAGAPLADVGLKVGSSVVLLAALYAGFQIMQARGWKF